MTIKPHLLPNLLILSLFFALHYPASALERGRVEIVTESGSWSVKVEFARTPEEQERGLMHRKSLAANTGMYFPFDPPRSFVAFWMADTPVALDILFINSQGKVIAYQPDAVPYSRDRIVAQGEIAAVLEVPAGTAQRIGLKQGDTVNVEDQ